MFELKFTELAKQLYKEKGIDFTPIRGTKLSAGYDLKLCIEQPLELYPDEVRKLGTGVHIYLGTNRHHNATLLAGLVLPRSSIKGLVLENTIGLIDADYQGEIFVKLKNTTYDKITLNPGERIVQYVITSVFIPTLNVVENFTNETIRGTDGHGSTGKF